MDFHNFPMKRGASPRKPTPGILPDRVHERDRGLALGSCCGASPGRPRRRQADWRAGRSYAIALQARVLAASARAVNGSLRRMKNRSASLLELEDVPQDTANCWTRHRAAGASISWLLTRSSRRRQDSGSGEWRPPSMLGNCVNSSSVRLRNGPPQVDAPPESHRASER